jgi:ABC-type glycerol-3-phosphate transport system permease component
VSVGLLNTYSALIITYTATAIPLGTWILIGFFEAIPKEMEECASLDGASLFTILWKIMVPIAWPGIMTVFILTLREGWNEFPFALAFTTDRTMRTLPYQLFLLRDTLGLEDWSIVSAFTILTIIPILVLFLVFQKHVVKSIMSGAMKS